MFQKDLSGLLEKCLTLTVDQYYGSTHCGQSLEDITWTQRHG